MANHRAMQLLHHCANTRTDIDLPCNNMKEVQSVIADINRRRRRIVKTHDESVIGTPEQALSHPLTLVKVCPRDEPPRVSFQYDHTFHQSMIDSEGNCLESLEEIEKKEYNRLAEMMPQKTEAPSKAAEQALMRKLGLTEDDMPVPDPTEQALEEAAKQKGRELTESERQHIIAAITPPEDFDL